MDESNKESPPYIYIFFEKQKDNYFQILENENNVICIKTEKGSNGYFLKKKGKEQHNLHKDGEKQ